jgi:endonuclease/exonuclease/phosphatase family metal-dependent hydrolase
MRIGPALVATLATSILATACVEDGEPLELATYNVGLAPGFVDLFDARLPEVGPYLATIDADLICVQEVFTDEHAAIVERALDGRFIAHREATEDDAGGDADCTAEESAPLIECTTEHCADATPSQLPDCVLSNCRAEYEATSSDCQRCLASNLGGTFEEILAACVGGSSSFAYRGRNGLMVLVRDSRWQVEYLDLPSTLVRRGALIARTDWPGIGEVTVACTHLATDVGVTYSGEFGSWQGENQAQAALVMAELPAGARPAVLLGDLNTGPDLGGDLRAEFPETYAAIVAAGFTAPYVEGGDAECTYCDGNTLNGGSGSGGKVIDHIFLRGLRAVDAGELLGTEPIEVEVAGEVVTTHLSDHFGLRMTVDTR